MVLLIFESTFTKMRNIVSLFALIFLFNSILLAQETTKSKLIDKDKKKYEKKVFDKEFGEPEDTTNAQRKLYDKIPDKLPDWVFNVPEIGSKVKVIGISDPNMPKDEAYAQAILRAKAMFALLNYSTISNITDDYTNLRESGKYSLYSTKFQDFSLSKARIAYNDSAIHIIDTLYTKYDEGIVLIEFEHNLKALENKDTIAIKGEHLQVFIEKNFRKERIEFFDFTINDKLVNKDSLDILAKYNYRIVNRGYSINSVFNSKLIEFQERTYNYRTDIDFSQDSTDLEINTFRLTRGLWNAYISGILSNITILSKQLASQVKNSNDYYTLRNEALVRTVASNKVSFGFNNFKMYENQFYIDLNGLIRQ